jgi:hypothetical protein
MLLRLIQAGNAAVETPTNLPRDYDAVKHARIPISGQASGNLAARTHWEPQRRNTFGEHPICVDILPRETSKAKANNNLKTENWFHSLPSHRFQALLTLFPKSFSSFPHGTCLLSVIGLYLALDDNYRPISAPLPKYATLRSYTVRMELPQNGTLTLHGSLFQKELSGTPPW